MEKPKKPRSVPKEIPNEPSTKRTGGFDPTFQQRVETHGVTSKELAAVKEAAKEMLRFRRVVAKKGPGGWDKTAGGGKKPPVEAIDKLPYPYTRHHLLYATALRLSYEIDPDSDQRLETADRKAAGKNLGGNPGPKRRQSV